jgi:hypothetical protein
VATQCDQCGQVDDHPKHHIGEVTKHHDCLSFGEKEMALASHEATPGALAKIIEACEGGTRGDKLVKFIESVHAEGAK